MGLIMIAIISAGIAPGFALLSYFYLKDEYEKEPILNVFRAFLLGVSLVFPIMFIQYVIDVEGILPSSFLQAFFSASLLEEFFKWFILYFTIYQSSEFDEHYDGIVYGVSLSLGYATLENILYLIGHGIEYAVGRAFLPVSSHALFGVIMGYYLGKSKFSNPVYKKRWILYSFFIPFVFHGIYDYILLKQENWFYIIVPFMIFLWWLALRKVKKAKHSYIIHFADERSSL
jgi:protease PrsW